MYLSVGPEVLPVIGKGDTVIIGGSLAGIAAAIQLAKAGEHVIVIEPRTYLGAEITATLMPWIETDGGHDETYPELIRALLSQQKEVIPLNEVHSSRDGESLNPYNAQSSPGGSGGISYVPLHPDRLKRGLEDMLLELGIQLIYASLPTEIYEHDGRLHGIVIANKSGRQAVRTARIVDASETAITAALLGEPMAEYPHGTTAYYDRTLEFTGTAGVKACEMNVPADLGISGNSVRLRFGYRGDNHIYVTVRLALNSSNTLEASRERERAARFISMALASHLIKNAAGFEKAVFSSASHELLGPYPLRCDGGIAGAHAGEENTEIVSLLCGTSEILCLYRDVYANGNIRLLNPVSAAAVGEQAAQFILKDKDPALGMSLRGANVRRQSVQDNDRVKQPQASVNTETPDYEISSISSFQDEWTGERSEVVISVIPVLKNSDVLVVGGGSSGACASVTAAREGMETVLLELNPGLGGTGTFGGVDSYWFGRRGGYAATIHDTVQRVQTSIAYKGHKWNIEAKMFALLQMATDAGTNLIFNSMTWGAVKKGSRVCGAAAATRWGPVILLADVVIDASGDGDLAAFAGADYVYGSSKDHTVMWYSLSQYTTPSKIQNNFTSMVDVSSVVDYTRAILAGRRRGEECHDHGVYVATRESRHIQGDVVMQLTDQLLHRRWPDLVNIHFSNHDVKGVSGADWVNIGLIPPNLEIEIPYRMLLPKGLEGILVAGKAISATHDALPAIRMQSDLENLGAVAALAAAAAVRSGRTPREIHVGLLQDRLAMDGLIPEHTAGRTLSSYRYSDEELIRLVDSIEEEPLHEYSNMRMNEIYLERMPFVEICSLGERVIPFLESALPKASGRKRMVMAQALSMLGAHSGVQVLIDTLMKELQGDELPRRTADIMYVQLPPDHGAMPDAANWLYSLAGAKDLDSLKVWRRVAELLRPDEEDFKDTWQGIYYYIDAVCQGAERLGSREAVPVLLQLHSIPYLQGQSCKKGAQPDYFLERRSMLELAIGRALARSGSKKGYTILIDYLNDCRSLLSKGALLELRRLSGKTLGRDAAAWHEWLIKEELSLQPQPLELQFDMEQNSEHMLRCVETRLA